MSIVGLETWLSELQSVDAATRIEAARQLGNSQSPRVVEPLIEVLEDPVLEVRRAASNALATLCPVALQQVLDQPATSGVFRSIMSTIFNLVQTGAGSLSPAFMSSPWQATPESLLALIAVLQTKQIKAQVLAIQGLGRSKSNGVVKHLLRFLKSEDSTLRYEASRALGQVEYSIATESLLEALTDQNDQVAQESAKSLGAIRDPSAIPASIKLMTGHRSEKVRRSARLAIVKFGYAAVPLLRAELPQFELATRLHLVEMLKSMELPSATGLLLTLLHDPAEEICLAAINALYYNRDPRVPAAIAELLDDDSHALRLEALEALSRQRSEAELLSALKNDAIVVRAKAAEHLRYLGSTEIATGLQAAIDDPDPSVRLKIAIALAAQEDPLAAEAAQPLIEAIDSIRQSGDTNSSMIPQALESLGSLRKKSELVVPYLRAWLNDPYTRFRGEIVNLFKNLQERRWIPELMSASADPDISVSQAATKAIRELKGMSRQIKNLERLCSLKLSKQSYEPPPPPPAVSQVSFTLVAPGLLLPDQATVLSVWAHLPEDTDAILPLASRSFNHDDLLLSTKAGSEIALGAELSVRLSIPGLEVIDPEDSMIWRSTIANASFPIRVPADARPGTYPGVVTIHVLGVRVSKLHFILNVGEPSTKTISSKPVSLPVQPAPHRTAFASYASADRDDVLSRIQGMHKIMPDLDIFVDVVTLRSGQRWADRLVEEIKQRDVFYLFWSKSARESEWVEKEWRMALEMRGIGYIDPVPLVAPTLVPPPKELAEHLHFNDWVLAFLRGNTQSAE